MAENMQISDVKQEKNAGKDCGPARGLAVNTIYFGNNQK